MTNEDDDAAVLSEGHPDLPSVVAVPSTDFPDGYEYGVTRYADIILREAFPEQFRQILNTLDQFMIDADELISGGGNRGSQTARFDKSLADQGWGKRNITISRHIDGKLLHETPGHEIDMFAVQSEGNPYPGIGVEMEWNNKDPFFDRDLLNFQALHREGALAVGVVVTRGPRLQDLLNRTVRTRAQGRSQKFGASTTHWNKLIPRVNLGGGGECPLLLIGVEPERVEGIEVFYEALKTNTPLLS